MKISFENPDKINGLLTMTVEEADYKNEVEKTLKDYRKRANIPGFRPGQVPMGMIKRQIGSQVKVDAINKILGEQLNKYIVDNKIEMLGQPLPSESQQQVDLDGEAPYEFKFDIAVAPEFKLEMSKKDKIKYYEITVDDKMVNDQIEIFRDRAGHYDKVTEYDPEQRDMLKGDLRELDEKGNTLEGGVVVEGAVMMPTFLKDDSQKKLFDGAKQGDIITFNPWEANSGNESELMSLLKIERSEVANHKGNFSYQITEITRFVKADNNKELWDSIYGEEAGINDEQAFSEKISQGIAQQLVENSEFRFMQDLQAYCYKKVGKLQFPDTILKRIMLANNKDKGQEFVDKNYEDSLKVLTNHIIEEKLAEAHNVKIDGNDIREVARNSARAQFMQFGMTNVTDEMLNKYADEILKKKENVDSFVEAARSRKVALALKDVVTLKKESITFDEFQKLENPK